MTEIPEQLKQYSAAELPVLVLHGVRGACCTCGRDSCRSQGKHPALGLAHRDGDPLRDTCRGECGRLGHGVHDATTDLAQIGKWAAQFPGCNWGVAVPANVVVVDVDPRHDGDFNLAALEREHAQLPPTLTQLTGSFGLHMWFGFEGPGRGTLGKGLDVKKLGGYVVVEPSTHASGGDYQWIDKRPVTWAPLWLRRLLSPPVPHSYTGPVSGRIEPLIKVVLAAQPGGRNAALFWAACKAAADGLDTAPLIDAALAVGLDGREATATIRSAQRRAAA